MRQEGVVYYLHSDHLGSTSILSDENGEQVTDSRVAYLPYGRVRLGDASTLPTDYTFTGQRNEAGPGLMHYGARFYSPRLGRFVSADSIVPDYEDPQALNRYAYVLNNPCRYTDPSGHCIPFCAPLLTYAAFRYLPRESLAFGARQLAQTDIPVVSDLAAWDARNTDLVWQAINRTDLQGNPLTTQEQLNLGFEGYTGLVGEAFTVYTAYEGVGALSQLGKAAYEGVTGKPPPSIRLRYKSGWTSQQKGAADAKVDALNTAAQKGQLRKTPVQRSGTSAASRYRSAGNQIPAGHDVDHAIDLQLSGSDDLENMWTLDTSVNRSLGAQIYHRLKHLPTGTRIGGVMIE